MAINLCLLADVAQYHIMNFCACVPCRTLAGTFWKGHNAVQDFDQISPGQ